MLKHTIHKGSALSLQRTSAVVYKFMYGVNKKNVMMHVIVSK